MDEDRDSVEVRVRKPHLVQNYNPSTPQVEYNAANGGKFIITEKEADMATPSISKSGAEQKGEVKEWD